MERQRLRDGVNANIMIKSAPLSKSTKCLKFLQSFCRVNTFRKPLQFAFVLHEGCNLQVRLCCLRDINGIRKIVPTAKRGLNLRATKKTA